MTLKQYLILMSFGTMLCWAVWFVLIWRTDPFSANYLIFLFFYFSLFLAVVGSFSVLGFIFRSLLIKNDEVIFRHVKKTFRQSVLLAIFLVLTLFLLQKDLLAWWNTCFLVVLFLVVEGIIFSNRRYSNKDYVQ